MGEPARSSVAQVAAPRGVGGSGSSRDRRGRDLSLCQLPPGARPPVPPGATGTPDPVPPGATGTPHPMHLPAPRGIPDSAPPGATGYPQGAVPHSAHRPVPSIGTPDSRRCHRGFLRTREPRLHQDARPGCPWCYWNTRPHPPCRTPTALIHRCHGDARPRNPRRHPTRPINPSGATRDDGSRSPGATGTPNSVHLPVRSARPRCQRDPRCPPPAPRIPVPPVPGVGIPGAPSVSVSSVPPFPVSPTKPGSPVVSPPHIFPAGTLRYYPATPLVSPGTNPIDFGTGRYRSLRYPPVSTPGDNRGFWGIWPAVPGVGSAVSAAPIVPLQRQRPPARSHRELEPPWGPGSAAGAGGAAGTSVPGPCLASQNPRPCEDQGVWGQPDTGGARRAHGGTRGGGPGRAPSLPPPAARYLTPAPLLLSPAPDGVP
ncbi:basic proline-rich protein-like [Catharus ustulatus]|uniref:basic proline-rich protein-like n=1 Tax=Catharus ustulatus TaxID=91951 RepID=UPI001409C9FF|nr:basic proline-rich protein-like [Catharus ustulatus]